MAEPCSACERPNSFLIRRAALTSSVVPLICLAPLLTFLVLPLFWRALGALLGWYLRRKTDGRRCHILEVVEADEQKYREERPSSTSSEGVEEDGGWEKVDAHVVGTARNGDRGDDDWDGIVGFFHPFW